MSTVQAISGATGDDLAKLSALAKEMGATTQFTAVESGKALEYMAMAGWKTNQMIGGLPGIMNLAAASGEDLGPVSDIVTDALTAFRMSAEGRGPVRRRAGASVKQCKYDFNPRSPCGERRQTPINAAVSALFQPTLPVRGADPAICGQADSDYRILQPDRLRWHRERHSARRTARNVRGVLRYLRAAGVQRGATWCGLRGPNTTPARTRRPAPPANRERQE